VKKDDKSKRPDCIPYYDEKEDIWAVDVDGRHEEGCIEYVASEFIKGGLFYPYLSDGDYDENYTHDHEHTFSGVLADVIRNPKAFSVEGYEEYYSKQELRMLSMLKARMLEMSDNSTDTATHDPINEPTFQDMINSLQRGLRDYKEGRVYTYEEAMTIIKAHTEELRRKSTSEENPDED